MLTLTHFHESSAMDLYRQCDETAERMRDYVPA